MNAVTHNASLFESFGPDNPILHELISGSISISLNNDARHPEGLLE